MLGSDLEDRLSIYEPLKSRNVQKYDRFGHFCAKNSCRIQFIMLMVLNGYLIAI